MQNRIWKLRLIGVCFASILPAAGAQTVTRKVPDLVEVTVTGQGTSKAEALRDAQRKAIERGAGAYIYSQSQVQDFVLKKDTILARSAGFIQKYDVLSTKTAEDGVVSMTVKAVVSVKGVVDTWGVVTNLLGQMGRPKLLVFINERIERPTRDGRWEEQVAVSTVQTRIENMLIESGFQLVKKKQLKAIEQKDLASAVAADKPDLVQAVAKRYGAQLFVTGAANAAAGPLKRIAGVLFYPYEAEANVSCYRSDTAQVLSSVPGASTRGVQRVWRSAAKQALDFQAQQIAPRVVNDILRFWMDALQGRGEVVLQVEGIEFKDYLKLKKALKTLKEIKAVSTQYGSKVAKCSIQSDVPAETLAEKLVEAIENLEVTDLSQNVIKAKLGSD